MGAVIALVSFIAVWWGLVKILRKKGSRAFVRHIAGFAAGFVALFIVVMVVSPDKKDTATAVAQNVTTAMAQNGASTEAKPAQIPDEPTLSVTVSQLSKEYEANEVAADQKYKGKKLRVTGSVQSIDKDAFNNIVVHLKATNQFMPAMASLDDKHEALAASLSKGKKITWQCKGGGLIIGSAVLNDCAPL